MHWLKTLLRVSKKNNFAFTDRRLAGRSARHRLACTFKLLQLCTHTRSSAFCCMAITKGRGLAGSWASTRLHDSNLRHVALQSYPAAGCNLQPSHSLYVCVCSGSRICYGGAAPWYSISQLAKARRARAHAGRERIILHKVSVCVASGCEHRHK